MVVQLGQETLLLIGDSNCFDLDAVLPYIESYQWPVDSDSVDHVTVQRVLEYLSGPQRIQFCNELYRVLKPGGKATLKVPYWSSANAVADPYLVWPPINELSLKYLTDAEFRERNRLKYPDITANFAMVWGNSYVREWYERSDAARDAAAVNWLNVIEELVVVLTKL